MQLEEHGNRKNPEVLKWLEWREKVKQNRLKMLAKRLSETPPATTTVHRKEKTESETMK